MAYDERRRIMHISNAFKGERVIAEDVSIRRRKQAYLIQVEQECSERCNPLCSQWRRCPACQFQGLDIACQARIKRDNWLRLIRKFVDISASCAVDFRTSLELSAYRHRTDALIFRTDAGLRVGILPRLDCIVYEKRQELAAIGADELPFAEMEADEVLALPGITPVELRNCALHAPELNQLIERVESVLEPLGFHERVRLGFEANGDAARVTVYVMPDDAQLMRIHAEALSRILEISVIFQVLPPRGSHVYPKPEVFREPMYCYTHDLEGHPLFALKGAWTPVNPSNARLIRDALHEMIGGQSLGRVLELGCGCGTHTALFRSTSSEYTGIDASWPAIQSAQYNAEYNHWENAVFYTDTAEHYLDKRYYGGRRADAILMHSNRMPYSAKTAQLCQRFGAKTIFIVAPTAFAMAQECRHFAELGYQLRRLVLCDTLPMTYHMMAAARLDLECEV